MANATTTASKTGSLILGLAITGVFVFGIVWVASKAWKKGSK